MFPLCFGHRMTPMRTYAFVPSPTFLPLRRVAVRLGTVSFRHPSGSRSRTSGRGNAFHRGAEPVNRRYRDVLNAQDFKAVVRPPAAWPTDSQPSWIHVVVETAHRLHIRVRAGRRRVPLEAGACQPSTGFPVAAPRYPTSLFTSKATPSRNMKKHAFASLLANALSAITRLVRAALR